MTLGPRRSILPALLLLLLLSLAVRLRAQAIDLDSPTMWTAARAPFSLLYGGKPSSTLLPTWRQSIVPVSNTPDPTVLYTWSDPATELQIIAEVRHYPDFPGVVDWVLTIRNNGRNKSPLLENINPLSLALPTAGVPAVLRHARGSDGTAQDFRPFEETINSGADAHIAAAGGYSSSGETLPFFNLQIGDRGLIAAIGWTGGWKADFVAPDGSNTLNLSAGMRRTHLALNPGEQIRTPRIVLMSWSAAQPSATSPGTDWIDAQNRWRRLLYAHYTPRDRNGQLLPGPVLAGSWGSEPLADKLSFVEWLRTNRIPVDMYAVDAGWYGDSVGAETDPTNPWWKNRGDWFPSPRYYPNGIKPLGDALRAAGIGFSLWIEPETAMEGRQIVRDHPSWFLHSDRAPNGAVLLNLGDPAARAGITRMLSSFITDFGMTWYRQDFNIAPERYWELADAPDRIGITEIRHIEGLYQMLDDLRREHPNLRIDNCASGGRRLDLEMMSRSFSIWRTDHGFADTLAEQAQTQALALWVPENMAFEQLSASDPWSRPGPYSTPSNLYLMRLAYSVGFGAQPGARNVQNEAWVEWYKQAVAEFHEVQPFLREDFFPLLPYSLGSDTWTVWQWDRPSEKDGVAIVLRRPGSPFSALELPLRHLDPAATYQVEVRSTYEHATPISLSGAALARLPVTLSDSPSSVLVFYRRQ